MARGQVAEVGTTRVAKNGYHYTKVAERGWVLTHWLTMEKKLGRQIDAAKEQVRFKTDKFKSDPYNIEGLVLIKKKTSSLRHRLAVVEDRIREYEAERDYLKRQIGDV